MFEFIHVEKALFSITELCRNLGVSRSGYHKWRCTPPSERQREDERLGPEIRAIHRRVDKRYGSPCVHAELLAQGRKVGRKRVARIMRQNGLRGLARRRFRRTTDFLRGKLGDEARVPALVVWLFVQALQEQGFLESEMPASIAALYFKFARYHAARVVLPEQVGELLEGLRTLARASVQLSGQIVSVRRRDAVEALKTVTKAGDKDVVQRLLEGSFFASREAGGVDYIRFSLDPIAEYLAMEGLALETAFRKTGPDCVGVAIDNEVLWCS